MSLLTRGVTGPLYEAKKKLNSDGKGFVQFNTTDPVPLCLHGGDMTRVPYHTPQ